MSQVKILHGKQTTDDYPYGRLRCTRSIEVEYAKNKGYRVVTQTICPKTGRLNAPKKGTYYTLILLIESPETGYTESLHFSLNGDKEIQKFLDFMRINGDQLIFSPEEHQNLYAHILASLRTGAEWVKFRKSAGETPTILQYMEAIQYPAIMKLYKDRAPIQDILALDIDLIKTMNLYRDDENGEAMRSFRIAG